MAIRLKTFVLAALTCLALGTAHAQQYNRFGPANGILKGLTSSPQTSAASATDVETLFGCAGSSSLFLNGGGGCTVPAGTGVSSVTLTVPAWLSVSGSPCGAGSCVLAISANSESANTFNAAPNGSSGTPTYRAIVAADLPSTAVTPGSYINANITVDAQGRLTSAATGSGGSTSPGGGNTDVQYNCTSAFCGATDFTYTSGGIVAGSATGGAKGAGTINAVGLFVNGVAASTDTPAYSMVFSTTGANCIVSGAISTCTRTGTGVYTFTSPSSVTLCVATADQAAASTPAFAYVSGTAGTSWTLNTFSETSSAVSTLIAADLTSGVRRVICH